MSEAFTITEQHQLEYFFSVCRERYELWGGIRATAVKISNKQYKRRDVLNRLSHAIYREAAQLKKEGTETDEKSYCKLRHGIPVLINSPEDGDECRDYYERLMKGVDYEARIARMAESHKFYIPVTSLMDDRQMSEYLERVVRDYAQQGYVILTPKEKEFLKYPEAQPNAKSD